MDLQADLAERQRGAAQLAEAARSARARDRGEAVLAEMVLELHRAIEGLCTECMTIVNERLADGSKW